MTNFDPPSDPFYEALRRGPWGGRMIREECPECEGEPEPFCELCDGTGYVWYEDLPDERETMTPELEIKQEIIDFVERLAAVHHLSINLIYKWILEIIAKWMLETISRNSPQ